MDSLLSAFEKLSPDTQKVNQLYQLCLAHNRSNLPKKIEQYAAEAMYISQKANYTKGLGFSFYVAGFAQYAKRNYHPALDNMLQSQKLLDSCKDIINSGRCDYTMANISYDMGKYNLAVKHAEQALKKWRVAGYHALNGECNNDLALAYARMGNYSKAVECAYKSYQAAEMLADKNQMAQSLHLMGYSFYEFKNYENALKNLTAASAIYLNIRDEFGFARNNNMIGEVLLEQGNYFEALQKFKQSLSIYSKPGAPAWGVPWAYSNIGSVFEAQGDSAVYVNVSNSKKKYTAALENYLLSLHKFQALKDPAGSAEQMIFIGKTFYKTGNITNAKKYLLDGLELAKKAGEKKHLASCYLFLSKIDSSKGDISGAYQNYKLHVLYRDSVYNLQSSQNLLSYKTQLDVEKKDHEITLLETENKLQKALSEKHSQGRNFAYLFAALFLTVGMYVFFRFKKQSKIKAEQKLLKERLAISQDLHDSIGSTLSSIAVYSQVAKIHGSNNEHENMNEVLEKISNASGEAVTEMNDIVWALNPRNDSMEKIMQRMESFAKPLAAARNIQFVLTYDPPLLNYQLDMKLRKNFYLIFKEAVNNAVKYSGAPAISVGVHQKDEKIQMQVKDNGVGFNPETALTNNQSSLSGNGLASLYKRTAEMNGTLTIESRPGKGSCITLLFTPY